MLSSRDQSHKKTRSSKSFQGGTLKPITNDIGSHCLNTIQKDKASRKSEPFLDYHVQNAGQLQLEERRCIKLVAWIRIVEIHRPDVDVHRFLIAASKKNYVIRQSTVAITREEASYKKIEIRKGDQLRKSFNGITSESNAGRACGSGDTGRDSFAVGQCRRSWRRILRRTGGGRTRDGALGTNSAPFPVVSSCPTSSTSDR